MLLNEILLPLNRKSKNHRIYTEESFNDIKNEYYGEFYHSDSIDIHINNISHYITNVRFKNNNLIGDVKILPTTKGKELDNLIKLGYKFVFRPKSYGIVSNEYVINSEIISFDAIPLSEDSFFNIREERKKKIQHLNERMFRNNNIL